MSEKRKTFWIAADSNPGEVFEEVKLDNKTAASRILDLRHQFTNAQNAIMHLSTCLKRACDERSSLERRLRTVEHGYEVRGDEIDKLRKQVASLQKKGKR